MSNWIPLLSEQFGVTKEAVRLVFAILISFPILILYRATLIKASPTLQHIFFILTGMLMMIWTFGIEGLFHASFCIMMTWLLLYYFGGSFAAAITLFSFNLGYLLIGYYFTETNTYDICWTMPHCILCLKLLAVSMDVYDGSKELSSLTLDQKENCLQNVPSCLELFSHCFFLGGLFIGPQYSFKRFSQFIQRNLSENLSSPLPYGCLRISIGVFYLAFHIFGSNYVPLEWVMTPEARRESNALKYFLLHFLWVKVMMSKYIGCWLLSEGAMIFSGMAYAGRDTKDTNNKVTCWTNGANVNLWTWEFSSKLGHLIESFNINTNKWSASYIYKRLKFMNNRMLSQSVTLLFLASWHGLHSGYYVTFFNEFLLINFEKDMELLVEKISFVQHLLSYNFIRILSWLLGKIYIIIFLPQCFVPFGLLTFDKYWPILKSAKLNLTLIFLSWMIFFTPIKKILLAINKQEKKEL